MLVIKSIGVKFDKKVIPVRIRKITVGYKKDNVANQKKYQQIDSHTFSWNEDITLPLYYNVPLNFSCQVDQNDCNPEAANAELTSTLKIIDYRGTNQQAFLVNRQNKKMATIAITYKVSNDKMIIPQEKGVAVISSILAHLNHYKGSKGFIQITLGVKQIYTPTVNVIAGQLLWAEELMIPVEELKEKGKKHHKIVFTIYLEEQPVGQGSFEVEPLIKSHIKYKKFDIVAIDNDQEKLGTLFIDIVFRERNVQNIPNILPKHDSAFLLEKADGSLLRQPSHHFFNSNSQLSVHSKVNTPFKSSKSQNKLLHVHNSQATAKILQKYEQKQRKKLQINLFDGIFNYGELNKQENIRQQLKERRKKQRNEGSLPKLK